MILIGIGHKARQGKDFVAHYMQEAAPSLVQLYSFARELKLYCKEHHNILLPEWQMANQTEQFPSCKDDPIYGYTPILQYVGMKFRQGSPNYWIDKVTNKIDKADPEIAIITDMRFENEAAFIKENGGYTVEVYRRNEDGTQMLDPGRDPKHISETALDGYNFDYTISVRDGDLSSLKAKALGVLSNIFNSEKEKYEANAGDNDSSNSASTDWF